MTTSPDGSTGTTDDSTGSPSGPAEVTGFAELGLRDELLDALDALGYEEPTPIQQEAIPHLLTGTDLLGQAATGTGKTAAFALPLLQRIRAGGGSAGRQGAPAGLVLVPTRELCMQVSEAMHKYGKQLGVRTLPVYGGQPVIRQVRELERGVDVVVATPGRAVDLIQRRSLRLAGVEVVVLDEADEMLDMGFAEELETILDACGKDRQTVLFSATMPSRLNAITRRHLVDPVRITIARAKQAAGEAPQVRQVAYLVDRAHKTAALGRVLDVEQPVATIVFCRTRAEVETLTETLTGRGYRAEALHGGMTQDQRDRVMNRLRSQTAELLVATDVAARGLDIDHLTHVVNYDVPSAAESYVHRIGRVGRGGREGVAITLAGPREQRLLQSVERVTGRAIAIEPLPSVADLRAIRLESTVEALREAMGRDDLADFAAVEGLVLAEAPAGTDRETVLLAAIALAHQARTGQVDEQDIPLVRPGSGGGRDGGRSGPGGGPGGGRSGPPREGGARDAGPGPGRTRLFVSSGRVAGMRPQDLVGAIANESQLSGKDIGPIVITERFSLVDVPDEAATDVIHALQQTRVKGRKVQVRRDRGFAGGPDEASERPERSRPRPARKAPPRY
ncbi:DEAD/DEAH box helicase [Jannaschia sp. R86511]|uniref:DEAD/DEAH box helicase n=1 Tax=Jannaschia sp. R86511 TaxID=3093853 RepID=UPI0036D3AA40